MEVSEREGSLIIVLLVTFSTDVIGFTSFGDSNDRMEFIEQLATHLKEGAYEESSDPIDRKIVEMVNLTAVR